MAVTDETVAGIPVLTIRGTPRAMGDSLGSLLRDSLVALQNTIIDYLQVHTPGGQFLDLSRLIKIIQPALETTSRFNPALWMELEGMSHGSGLPIEMLLLIHSHSNIFDFLGSSMPPSASAWLGIDASHARLNHPFMAWAGAPDPRMVPHLHIIRRQPSHAPRSLSLSFAGLHPLIGISEARLAIAWNELRVNDGAIGLSVSHLIAHILSVPDFEGGVKSTEISPRFGGGAVHLLASDGRRASVEMSGQHSVCLDDPDPGMPRVHTNHPIAEALLPLVTSADTDSLARLGRFARRAVTDRDITPPSIASWCEIGEKKSMSTSLNVPATMQIVATAHPQAAHLTLSTARFPAASESVAL